MTLPARRSPLVPSTATRHLPLVEVRESQPMTLREAILARLGRGPATSSELAASAYSAGIVGNLKDIRAAVSVECHAMHPKTVTSCEVDGVVVWQLGADTAFEAESEPKT